MRRALGHVPPVLLAGEVCIALAIVVGFVINPVRAPMLGFELYVMSRFLEPLGLLELALRARGAGRVAGVIAGAVGWATWVMLVGFEVLGDYESWGRSR